MSRGLKPGFSPAPNARAKQAAEKGRRFLTDWSGEKSFLQPRVVLRYSAGCFSPFWGPFTASRHTSALEGRSWNRDQPAHTHQVVSRDGQAEEPIHSSQPAYLHLTQATI